MVRGDAAAPRGCEAMTEPRYEPLDGLRVLTENRVRFVVIGGAAGNLHGSTSVTNDLDICYARDPLNHARLVKALRSVNARLRGVEDDVPFILDEKTIEMGDHFTFVTDVGDLDILGTPKGVEKYEEMERVSREMDLGGFSVRVASMDDLIAMKRAAGRPKDLIELEILGALREELEERGEL